YGMLAAVFEAGRSGQGQVVDASMVDGVASLMTGFFGLRGAGAVAKPASTRQSADSTDRGAAEEPKEKAASNSTSDPEKPKRIAPTDPSRQTGLLRHLHWWLAIAMLPLAFSIFLPRETPEELEERFIESLADMETPAEDDLETSQTSPGSEMEFNDDAYDEQEWDDEDDVDAEFIFSMLPGRKLKGAFLARDSYVQWLFAGLSAFCYLTLYVMLATNNAAKPTHLLGLGAFTATAGIALLLALQTMAFAGASIRGGGAAVGVVKLVLVLIGLSYQMALDPETGVIVSFLGFTAGVGFWEEFIKAIPLMIYFRLNSQLTWRGAFLWGLASGTGFGIAEGIMYSQQMYNGISGPTVYAVRFISCVALHAVWTGAVGISIQQRRELLQENHDDWWMYLIISIRLLAIPIVLHGLYDTLLKKEMPLLALLTAAASFGYLAWLFGRFRGDDEAKSRARFVADYIRKRQIERGR
ncbi:MAG: PrsW family glutamic-type intramembrane protease, partial [Pirellulaceae bacterium]|nr:PrsW family glutamic-type intramembrane protease [Pirellulaceae bacterium]